MMKASWNIFGLPSRTHNAFLFIFSWLRGSIHCRKLKNRRGSGGSGNEMEELTVPAESLEKDEELRMHILGHNSFFTQP